MTSSLLMKAIAELFLVMIMGYILAKVKIVKTSDSKILSAISLYLVMPCVVINAFQIDNISNVRKGLIFAICLAIVIHITLAFIIMVSGKIFKLKPEEKLSVMYSNAGNLIIPIVTSILGPQWVIYSSAFIIVQLVLLWTHGRFVISASKTICWRSFLLNINLISIIIGFMLFIFQIELPAVIVDSFSSVADMIGPLCMLSAGILFSGINLNTVFRKKRIYIVTFLRMLVCPLFILILLKVCRLNQFVTNGNIIQLISFLATITPTAATVTQMTQVYGGDAENATGIYVITTLIAIITMPVFVELYQIL